MDEQVLQLVKECAISYLGVKMDDIVSVAEVLIDSETQSYQVSVQGDKVSDPEKCWCIIVVKDGEASILDAKKNGDENHEQPH
jgi:hypothetical protein